MGIAGSTENAEEGAMDTQNRPRDSIHTPTRVRERVTNHPQLGIGTPQQYVANGADDVVPTVFKWEGGNSNCRSVYITGTFNNWERQLPMHRSGNDFTCVLNLKRGKHAYKFIVDNEWRFDTNQPTVADNEGRINNYIDVADFSPYTGDERFFYKSKERKIAAEEYRQHIPELEEYTKEPPALPPHLRHIILNKPPPTPDLLSLPVPQHVALNHLYCTAIKDNIMVLGATQRYRDKYVTIVFYAMMPVPTPPSARVAPY